MIQTRITIEVYKLTGKFYTSYSYLSEYEPHNEVLIHNEVREKYKLNGFAYTIAASKGDAISKRIYF